MVTVGIITYHNNNNYGTMLQALALQRKITYLGYKCEIIDYRFRDLENNRIDHIKTRINRIQIYLKEFNKYYTKFQNKHNEEIRAEKFREFYRNNMVVSTIQYNTLQELIESPPQYDIYIVGSDQTWNPNVGKKPKVFYLTFAPKDKIRASYAPSIGVRIIDDEEKAIMKQLLENVTYLSCREEIGSKIISEITGKNVTTVLDPTLLLSPNEWNEFTTESIREEPYILQYFLGDIKECRDFTNELSKRTGYPIICLPFSCLDMQAKLDKRFDVGPSEFLNLIKNAAFVCTDSFHGTVFSINFQKKFFSFSKRNEIENISDNSRLYDILNRLNLTERLIRDYQVPDKEFNINYEEVNLRLKKYKKQSLDYLRNILTKTVKESSPC